MKKFSKMRRLALVTTTIRPLGSARMIHIAGGQQVPTCDTNSSNLKEIIGESVSNGPPIATAPIE